MSKSWQHRQERQMGWSNWAAGSHAATSTFVWAPPTSPTGQCGSPTARLQPRTGSLTASMSPRPLCVNGYASAALYAHFIRPRMHSPKADSATQRSKSSRATSPPTTKPTYSLWPNGSPPQASPKRSPRGRWPTNQARSSTHDTNVTAQFEYATTPTEPAPPQSGQTASSAGHSKQPSTPN